MAELPRLPAAVEHRFLKFVCGLPPWLQRRLFGPPPVVEGQRLESDIHALLRIAQLFRGDSLRSKGEPAAARAERLREAQTVAHRPPIQMARVEALEIPSPAGDIGACLYVAPTASRNPPPLLVYFHGGGWVIGDLETHDDPCRFLAVCSGAAVLAIDYRLAPEHPFPAAAEDAEAAYAWAVANGGRLGVDAARIAIGGDSAGANLAAAVCLTARDRGDPLPAMQLLIYPVTDAAGEAPSRRTFGEGFLLTHNDMDWFEERYLPRDADRTDPRVSVLRAPDLGGLPPAYIATGGFDPLRDEGEAFAERLREAGVRVALRRHPGLVHTFANLTAICPSARAAMLEAAGALRLGLAA
ncbi:MAG TPA: alpha/beta hydrolase [Solirubrobacterales bacterium]|jgi:acetyl esterase|nr:alpha/beta hydrolase [Solirubrobacterales bacterium]